MKRIFLLTLLAAGLTSCAIDAPYHPATKPEKIEFRNDRLDVYPEDVRKDLSHYTDLHVAWAGIIVTNDANEVDNDGIRMDTLFEHHYFDWEQDEHGSGVRLLISPRGEGNFRMRWHMSRKDQSATYVEAMKFATPGKLALVYGTPESVDDDGTIVMHYHYIRILGPAHFTANELDYGRAGEPFHPVDARPSALPVAPSR